MRLVTSVLACVLTVTAGAACTKKKAATDGSGSGAPVVIVVTPADAAVAIAVDAVAMAGSAADPTMAGSGSDGGGLATVPEAGGSGAMELSRRTGNCPSTVFGSTTTAKVEKNVIIVAVTATDKDATESIRKRAEELLKEKADATGATGTAHDHKGTHGGGAGICPIYVPANATAAATTIAGGTEIRITVSDGKVDDLKRAVDDRITKSADWVKTNIKPGSADNSGGVGGGVGEHGSNHTGQGDGHGKEREGVTGRGKGTGGGSGKGTGGGSGATK